MSPKASPSGRRPVKGKGPAGLRRARSSEEDEAPQGEDPRRDAAGGERRPRGSAKDRALVLLGVRWRSRKELERRLRMAGFDLDQVEAALADLETVGLVDDARFATELVRDRVGRRLMGDRAIRLALAEKGVPPEVAEQALSDAGDETDRARALASARAVRLSSLSPEAAYRRLFGVLVRRGYGPGVAREAARRALAEALGPWPVGEDRD